MCKHACLMEQKIIILSSLYESGVTLIVGFAVIFTDDEKENMRKLPRKEYILFIVACNLLSPDRNTNC